MNGEMGTVRLSVGAGELENVTFPIAVSLTMAVWVLSARTGEEGSREARRPHAKTALKKVDAQGEGCIFMETVG